MRGKYSRRREHHGAATALPSGIRPHEPSSAATLLPAARAAEPAGNGKRRVEIGIETPLAVRGRTDVVILLRGTEFSTSSF
jgi:hypothetical protein